MGNVITLGSYVLVYNLGSQGSRSSIQDFGLLSQFHYYKSSTQNAFLLQSKAKQKETDIFTEAHTPSPPQASPSSKPPPPSLQLRATLSQQLAPQCQKQDAYSCTRHSARPAW